MTPELTSLLEELRIRESSSAVCVSRPGRHDGYSMLEVDFLAQHGYGHTKLVLTSIHETRSNARGLVAPVIWAVSDLIVAHPAWADRVSDWLAAFDKVDICHLRAFAKQNKSAVKPRAAIATLLSDS